MSFSEKDALCLNVNAKAFAETFGRMDIDTENDDEVIDGIRLSLTKMGAILRSDADYEAVLETVNPYDLAAALSGSNLVADYDDLLSYLQKNYDKNIVGN